MSAGEIIGVDLGTTNSCAAIVDGENNGIPHVKLIPYKGGEYTVPSIFAMGLCVCLNNQGMV